MIRESKVQSEVESYQQLKKLCLIPTCLTLGIIRYRSRVSGGIQERGPAGRPRPRSAILLPYIINVFKSTLSICPAIHFAVVCIIKVFTFPLSVQSIYYPIEHIIQAFIILTILGKAFTFSLRVLSKYNTFTHFVLPLYPFSHWMCYQSIHIPSECINKVFIFLLSILSKHSHSHWVYYQSIHFLTEYIMKVFEHLRWGNGWQSRLVNFHERVRFSLVVSSKQKP